ncbi:peptidoglycan-binding domain-containing protein [Leifsonia sp. 22587]|uniref:peptidoglycan-binding domain-containing protein n=1 Tax=Leifsonia sp. 22587 TaxID=3453946 RepID=UPI003F870976
MSKFDDSQKVEFSVSHSSETTLPAPDNGVVTAAPCEPGNVITNGGAAVSIDGVPRLALAMPTPLWRNLSIGDHGPDVASLQQGLSMLGLVDAVDGRMGQRTLTAFNQALQNINAPHATAVELTTIVWVPSPASVVSKCTSTVGSRVESGQSLLTVRASGSTAQVPLPDDGLVGARVLQYGGQSFEVDSSGRAVIPDALAAGKSTDPDAASSSSRLTGVVRLKVSTDAYSLPPSSIYSVIDSTGCVESAQGVLEVKILGSSLGQTFVAPLHAQHLGPINIQPRGTRECR